MGLEDTAAAGAVTIRALRGIVLPCLPHDGASAAAGRNGGDPAVEADEALLGEQRDDGEEAEKFRGGGQLQVPFGHHVAETPPRVQAGCGS